MTEFFNRDVETCCFCCQLKTGNIIIGATNAILSGLSIIAVFSSDGEYNEETGAYDTYSGEAIFLLIFFLVKFLFDLLFVYGVIKGISRFVHTYYLTYLVLMGFWALAFILFLAAGKGMMVFTVLIHFFVNAYAFVVCRSYYRQLMNREQV